MKKSFTILFAVGILSLVPAMLLKAADPTDEVKKVYQDPERFDGGPGSTLNEPHATAPDTDVPEVGEPKVVTSSGTASGFEVNDSSGTATDQNTEEQDENQQ